MKVHTKIVIDLNTNLVMEDEFFEYEGLISSCDPVTATVAAVGGSLVSGYLGSESAEDAAYAQSQASTNATAEQRRQFNLMRSDTAPYREAGSAAIGRLGGLYGLPGYDSASPESILSQTPGYQFRLSEGNKALDRFQSAGRITGGRALKEAMRYGQDYASGEYGNYLQGLFNLTGQGSSSVNTATQAGQNAASNIGQYNLAAGQGQAAGAIGGASAWNNAIQGGLQNYMTLSMYNDLNSRFKSPVGYTRTLGTGMGSGGYGYAPD